MLGAGHFFLVNSNEPVKNGCEVIYETFHISLHNRYCIVKFRRTSIRDIFHLIVRYTIKQTNTVLEPACYKGMNQFFTTFSY